MKIETTSIMTIEFTNKELAEALRIHASEQIMRRFGSCINAGIQPKVKVVARECDDSAYIEVSITEIA